MSEVWSVSLAIRRWILIEGARLEKGVMREWVVSVLLGVV